MGSFSCTRDGRIPLDLRWTQSIITSAWRKSWGAREEESFFRLFMVPGMGQCFDGPEPNLFGNIIHPPQITVDAEHDADERYYGPHSSHLSVSENYPLERERKQRRCKKLHLRGNSER